MMQSVIDAVPWRFLLEVMIVATVILVMVQIKTGDCLDQLRWHQTARWLFRLRRHLLFLMLLSLLWMGIYCDQTGWQPWPPVVVFLAAWDGYVVSHVMVMRRDVERLMRISTRRRTLSGDVGRRV